MFVILSALLLVINAEPDPTKGLKAPAVKFLGADKGGGLLFEVSNPNGEELPYLGYTADSIEGGLAKGVAFPLYRLELGKDKAWKPHQLGWCKTGVGAVAVPAKGKATFVVHPPQGEWEDLRVGLLWYKTADGKGGADTAWSEGVTRDAVAPKK